MGDEKNKHSLDDLMEKEGPSQKCVYLSHDCHASVLPFQKSFLLDIRVGPRRGVD